MLTKTTLRVLAPGKWARVRVPDTEQWQKPCEWSGPLAGKEVDICVIPCYGPRYDSVDYFHWCYRVAYRHPSALSQVSLGVGRFSEMADPAWHKEVCHAKEVYRSAHG